MDSTAPPSLRKAAEAALEALRPFTFPGRPGDFHGAEEDMTEGLFCDTKVRRARIAYENLATALAREPG
jgi:hypothetical protein